MSFITRFLLLFMACAAVAQAQTYPSKPTRIIVGFVAGGPSDLVARMVAQGLTERMGQQFLVENRPGATGIIGAELVAKAPPDGYMLYLASQTTHAVAPALYAKVEAQTRSRISSRSCALRTTLPAHGDASFDAG